MTQITSDIKPYRVNKVSLGNSPIRYNSHVDDVRDKFYINSTRNSEDVPQWMNRTQRHYFKHKNTYRPIFNSANSPYQPIIRANIYSDQPQVPNTTGQFQYISKIKPRSKWEMKNQTFGFEWPKKSQNITTPTKISNHEQRSTFLNKTTLFGPQSFRTNRRQNYFRFQLPKYGIKQSPLHKQKQTPVKIGHSAIINSIVIQ